MMFLNAMKIIMGFIYLSLGIYILFTDDFFELEKVQKLIVGFLFVAYGTFRLISFLKEKYYEKKENENVNDDEI